MRMTPTLERLSRLDVFAQCDRRELAAIASRTTTVHARSGDVLMREGSVGRELMVIVEGQARVVRRGETVAMLGPGDVVGEVALLDRGPRTATVIAESAIVAEVSNPQEFAELLVEVPSLGGRLLRQLAGRLRDAMAS
jgi:CRP/FNR family cyclic AMP-dependent transcriptional regulator